MLRILRLFCSALLVSAASAGVTAGPGTPPTIDADIGLNGAIVEQGATGRSFAGGIAAIQSPQDRQQYCGAFPFSCKQYFPQPLTMADYLRCPVNIPYCQREACSPDPSYNSDPIKCLSIPGCCYDVMLRHYRRFYQSDKLMEGAPLCYKAVQNKQFLKYSRQYVPQIEKKWDPSFSMCVMRQHKDDIDRPIPGCSSLEMLEFFGYAPQMTGWDGITQQDCHYMGNCWIVGRGCFRPMAENMAIPSGALPPMMQNNPNYRRMVVGKPKCQTLSNDMTSPATVLKTYNKCLLAGCTVHKSFTDRVYYQLFGKVSENLSDKEKRLFRQKVLTSEIGPDNFEEKLVEIQKTIKLNEQITNWLQTIGLFGPITAGLETSFQQPGAGGRSLGMSGPIYFGDPNACPYAFPNMPGGHQMTGSTSGCCKFNLCFSLLGSDVARSGISHYYTRWGQWTQCTKSCGGGTRTRSRRCVTHPSLVGTVCTQSTQDSGTCNEQPCPQWSEWGPYGECSRKCGGGQQMRFRQCLPQGSTCPGSPAESRSCQTGACPTFSPWSKYGACSTSCGEGTQTRKKTCTDPGAYGCGEQEITQSKTCVEYCGKVVWPKTWSACNTDTCKISLVGQCLHKGNPGYCLQRPPYRQERSCFEGFCVCKLGLFDCSGFGG